jgi:hypothetical protein
MVIGGVKRRDDGPWLLLLPGQRWWWDASVEPPRFRMDTRAHPRAGAERRRHEVTDAYARNWAAGVIEVRDDSGEWWLTISMPTAMECGCGTVQTVERTPMRKAHVAL